MAGPYASSIQTDTSRCLVCGGAETRDSLFVAVLTPTRGKHHWMHAGTCYEQHREKCAAERQAMAAEMLL